MLFFFSFSILPVDYKHDPTSGFKIPIQFLNITETQNMRWHWKKLWSKELAEHGDKKLSIYYIKVEDFNKMVEQEEMQQIESSTLQQASGSSSSNSTKHSLPTLTELENAVSRRKKLQQRLEAKDNKISNLLSSAKTALLSQSGNAWVTNYLELKSKCITIIQRSVCHYAQSFHTYRYGEYTFSIVV